MVRVLYTDRFLRSARSLPAAQQTKLAAQLESLRDNPFHRTLHTKALSGQLSGLYSFRITRDWRVIFQFLSSDTVSLVDVGHRRDIYR
jgi:addiction module RelE/StbE family toxin